jgi:cell division septal protein FtsQ
MAVQRKTKRGGKKKKRFQVFRLVLKGLFLFLLFTGIAWPFYHYVIESPRFRVQSIQVEGANVLHEEAILAVAGITRDDNLLFFDPEAIAEKIEAMPYVRHCDVRRVWPDLVTIRIEERAAMALLLVNNHLFEVDGEGIVLRELDRDAPWSGPLITNVPDLGFVAAGRRIEAEELHQALGLWQAFRRAPAAEDLTLSEISAAESDCLKLFFDEIPCETRWGRGDYRKQARRFSMLWEALGHEIPCEEYLDLRFDRDLVCR